MCWLLMLFPHFSFFILIFIFIFVVCFFQRLRLVARVSASFTLFLIHIIFLRKQRMENKIGKKNEFIGDYALSSHIHRPSTVCFSQSLNTIYETVDKRVLSLMLYVCSVYVIIFIFIILFLLSLERALLVFLLCLHILSILILSNYL